jgi:hypothetical protein
MATNEETIVIGQGATSQNNNTATRQSAQPQPSVPPRPNIPPRPQQSAQRTQQGAQRPAFQPVQSNDDQTWKRIVVGGVAGIMFGTVSAVGATAAYHHFSNNGDNDELEVVPEDMPDEAASGSGHYMLDNGMMIAEVDNSMSFSEAFATAREEVGPGGAFVWHGNVYATYTENEWNSMSPSERHEFTHMSLSALNSDNSYTPDDHVDVVYHEHEVHIHLDDDISLNDDDVQIVGIEGVQGNVDGHDVYMVDVDQDDVIDVGGIDDGFAINTSNTMDDGGLLTDNMLPGVDDSGMPDYVNDAGGDLLV